MKTHRIQLVIIKLIINQVIFIILATFKKKKWSKPLRVRSKSMKGKGQGSHFATLEKTLTLGQG